MSNQLEEIILISDNSGEKSVVSYDACTGNQLKVYKYGGIIAPHTLQVLRDSYLLAADTIKPRLYLWPLNSQTPLSDVHLPTPGKVSALACAPNGKFAVAAINEKLFLWQLCNGRLLATLSGHFLIVTTIRFNADGSCFASAADDCLIFIWSLGQCANNFDLPEDSCKPLYKFSDHSGSVKDICFGSFARRSILCSVSLDKSLKIYDTSTGCILQSLIFDDSLTSVCLDTNENFIYVGTLRGSIMQFNLRDKIQTIDCIARNRELKVFNSHEVAISCLAVSLDCMTLLSGDYNGKVIVWNIMQRKPKKEFVLKGKINNAIFSKAYENYKAHTITPSIAVKTLKWSSGDSENDCLEIICENEWSNILNYDDYVKPNEFHIESSDKTLATENEKLKRINNSLMRIIMKNKVIK